MLAGIFAIFFSSIKQNPALELENLSTYCPEFKNEMSFGVEDSKVFISKILVVKLHSLCGLAPVISMTLSIVK